MQRLKKKMFWNKNLSSQRGLLTSSNQNLNTILTKPELTKPITLVLNDNTIREELDVQQNSTQRSSSLHYVGSEAANTDKPSTHLKISKKMHNSTNISSGVASSLANSTLKPFYNKLKKHYLFGTKLEKTCGPHSATNNQLPSQIMVCEHIHELKIYLKYTYFKSVN